MQQQNKQKAKTHPCEGLAYRIIADFPSADDMRTSV